MPNSRDIEIIRADLEAAGTKRDRLGNEMASFNDGRELTSGELGSGSERVERGAYRAQSEYEALDAEWRDATERQSRLSEIQRSARSGYTENGDGAGPLQRSRGAENLYAGMLQSGRRLDDGAEDAIISRALRTVDDHHRGLSAAQGDAITELLRSDRNDQFDPGYVARRVEVTMSPAYRRFGRPWPRVSRGSRRCCPVRRSTRSGRTGRWSPSTTAGTTPGAR